MDQVIYLTLAAFFSSIISGAIGMGGGILLLTIMSGFLPITALVPIHGVVQWGSNTSRLFFNLKHLDKKIFFQFITGAVLGALIGSQFHIQLPELQYKIALAIFILVATWIPKYKSKKDFKYKFQVLGFLVTPISLFVGATGPILAPFFLRQGLSRHSIVATKAACQFAVHSLKIAVFTSFGFAFGQYTTLMICMVLAVIAGSYVGKLLLDRLPEKIFVFIFKIIITLLAFRLIYQALS